MKTIRKGTFETNSSSTHAIVIPKKVNEEHYDLYNSYELDYSFGRQESRLCQYWDEKLAYAYIILQTNVDWNESGYGKELNHHYTKKDLDEFENKVNKLWKEMNENNYDFNPNSVFNYIKSNGAGIGDEVEIVPIKDRWKNYVDHANQLEDSDFMDRLLNDEEFLKRFLFNDDSYITIGGDEYRGFNIKTIGFEYDYEDYYTEKGEFWKRLEEYKKENDVYLKGN